MPYLHLILRAIKPETNVNRVYEIRVDRGLFNSWLVIIAYGRYRGGACQKIHSFFNIEDVKKFVQKTLKKRVNSQKRIGCYYKIVKANDFAEVVPISGLYG